MKKANILWIILGSVFLVIFNVIFFVAGGANHPASVWISYAFIHFAYGMLLVTPFLVRKGGNPVVFGFPLFSVSTVYFFAAFLAGVIFVVIASQDFRTSLILQLVVAGIYAVILIGVMIANESTAGHNEQRQQEVNFIKTASAKLKAAFGRVSDEKLKKKIEKAYETVKFSPVKSDPSAAGLEKAISDSISLLGMEIDRGDSIAAADEAAKIVKLTEERSRALRLAN